MPINVQRSIRDQETGFPHEVTCPRGDTGTVFIRPDSGNTEFWLKIQHLYQELMAKKKEGEEISVAEDADIKRKSLPGLILTGWKEEDFPGFPTEEPDGTFSFVNAERLLRLDWFSDQVSKAAKMSGPRLRVYLKRLEDERTKKAKGSEKPSSGESDTEPNSSDSTAVPQKPARHSKKK